LAGFLRAFSAISGLIVEWYGSFNGEAPVWPCKGTEGGGE
jgi:hypothetical protein